VTTAAEGRVETQEERDKRIRDEGQLEGLFTAFRVVRELLAGAHQGTSHMTGIVDAEFQEVKRKVLELRKAAGLH
jgi:hypothetical protein